MQKELTIQLRLIVIKSNIIIIFETCSKGERVMHPTNSHSSA